MAEKNGNNSTGPRRLWLVILAILVAVVILAAFISRSGKQVAVRAAPAQRAEIASAISTNGKIEPADNFEAHAAAPTTVKRVLVHEGDRVTAGQLLVQLDDAEARAQAARALAQLRAAQADLNAVKTGGTREEVLTTESQLAKAKTERDAAQRNLDALQRLQQRGAASAGEVQEARNRLERATADLNLLQQKQTSRFSNPEVERVQAAAAQAQAAHDAAEDTLRNSNVRAPRAGVVYSLAVRPGQFVNAGDLLVQVADLRTVQVRAFVDEPDIGRLRPGEEVDVTWDALPGRVWHGAVSRVPTAVLTRGTRNVGEITCTIANPDLKLLPNTNVNVNVITAKVPDALTVAREAVHQDARGRFVYQIVGDRLERRDVETAISNLTRVEVTQGLTDNALVALGTMDGKPLKNGMAVRVVSR